MDLTNPRELYGAIVKYLSTIQFKEPSCTSYTKDDINQKIKINFTYNLGGCCGGNYASDSIVVSYDVIREINRMV